MSDWVVIPAALTLRDEFNRLNENRDKGADGTKGDSNHSSTSDHTPDEDSDSLRNKDSDNINEVHALDVDSTGPWPNGVTFKDLFLEVIAGEKKKWQDPNDKSRLNNAIYDRQIYDNDNDFNPVPYTGSDPHTGHGHFSFRYETSCENDTRPFGLAKFGDELPVDQATFDKMMAASWKNPTVINSFLDSLKITDYADTNTPQRSLSLRTWIGYSEGRGQVAEVLESVEKVEDNLTSLTEKVDAHIAGLVEANKKPIA